MAVTPNFTAEQSIDGKTITLTNNSVFTSPDVAGSFAASFTLTDAFGVVLATIPIPTGQTVVTFAVTKDLWLDIVLNLTGATNYSKALSYWFFRITANKLISINQDGCDGDRLNIMEALRFIKGAEYAAPTGNKVAFQTNMDYANIYLDLAV